MRTFPSDILQPVQSLLDRPEQVLAFHDILYCKSQPNLLPMMRLSNEYELRKPSRNPLFFAQNPCESS